jgi:hypothetical protein
MSRSSARRAVTSSPPSTPTGGNPSITPTIPPTVGLHDDDIRRVRGRAVDHAHLRNRLDVAAQRVSRSTWSIPDSVRYVRSGPAAGATGEVALLLIGCVRADRRVGHGTGVSACVGRNRLGRRAADACRPGTGLAGARSGADTRGRRAFNRVAWPAFGVLLRPERYAELCSSHTAAFKRRATLPGSALARPRGTAGRELSRGSKWGLRKHETAADSLVGMPGRVVESGQAP